MSLVRKIKAKDGKDQAQIGKSQIKASNDKTGHGSLPGERHTNKDKLELAREGTKNFIKGTIKKNSNTMSGAEKNARKARKEHAQGTKRTTG